MSKQTQMSRILEILQRGKALTLPELHDLTGDPLSSISAQIRHLRKSKNGSHKITRRRRQRGLYEYKLETETADRESSQVTV